MCVAVVEQRELIGKNIIWMQLKKKPGVLSNFSIKLSVGLEAVMSIFGWESKVGLLPGLSVATSTVCALELIEMLSFVGFGTSKHDDWQSKSILIHINCMIS